MQECSDWPVCLQSGVPVTAKLYQATRMAVNSSPTSPFGDRSFRVSPVCTPAALAAQYNDRADHRCPTRFAETQRLHFHTLSFPSPLEDPTLVGNICMRAGAKSIHDSKASSDRKSWLSDMAQELRALLQLKVNQPSNPLSKSSYRKVVGTNIRVLN